MWTTVALLTAVYLAPNDAGVLKLDSVRSTHGILGPARAAEKYVPGDGLTLNFDIDGITVDAQGKVLYSIAIEVANSSDKSVVFRQPAQKQEATTVFGGNRIQGFAHLDLGTEQPPGDYVMTVTVTDLASKAAKDFTHKFTVVKPDFALVRVKTSTDREGDFPVPVLGQGQTIWLNFGVVGFARDKTSKQPSVLLELNVLDESGKATLDKPLSKVVGTDVPDKGPAIPLQFPLSLTRAGKFSFEITATDQVTKKTAKFVLPLNVHAVK